MKRVDQGTLSSTVAERGHRDAGETDFDVVVVGAGFGGLYALHSMRGLGLSTRVIEAGSGVGGTWFWNRYPGARCDVDSVDYSYSFSPELQEEWTWSARFAEQPEILAYLNHVADRFDLRRDIQFDTRVVSATYIEESQRWDLRTDTGEQFTARYCIMATGNLSTTNFPAIAGIDSFAGESYHTGAWPEDVDFTGKRVGLIGTGSTGIQAATAVARTAEQLYVFQRTPHFSIPACDHPLDDEFVAEVKATYTERRRASRASLAGFPYPQPPKGAIEYDEPTRTAMMEEAWTKGGNAIQFTFNDVLTNPESNALVSEFIRGKIREVVNDPAVGELLAPKTYPFGTKRVCKDTDYYETYNRSNVTLVDVQSAPIVQFTPNGIHTEDGEYELDAVIFATGFDAVTGTLLRANITGRDGLRLEDAWHGGPQTYLGLGVAGFPNMFIVTGPGSPSVLTNMVMAIEQHIEWITRCIGDLETLGYGAIEPTVHAQSEWVAHVNEVASQTLYMQASSWYLGANVPGKVRVFMPYIGGFSRYSAICDEVAAEDYRGFILTADRSAPAPAVHASASS